jgi:hypothetical protein
MEDLNSRRKFDRKEKNLKDKHWLSLEFQKRESIMKITSEYEILQNRQELKRETQSKQLPKDIENT